MLSRVHIINATAVDSWEYGPNFLSVIGDTQDDDERDGQDEENDNKGEKLALDVVHIGVMAVFPNNVSGLRSVLEAHLRLSKNGAGGLDEFLTIEPES